MTASTRSIQTGENITTGRSLSVHFIELDLPLPPTAEISHPWQHQHVLSSRWKENNCDITWCPFYWVGFASSSYSWNNSPMTTSTHSIQTGENITTGRSLDVNFIELDFPLPPTAEITHPWQHQHVLSNRWKDNNWEITWCSFYERLC